MACQIYTHRPEKIEISDSTAGDFALRIRCRDQTNLTIFLSKSELLDLDDCIRTTLLDLEVQKEPAQ